MTDTLSIASPDPNRPPLRTNIYEQARGLTSTLAPLFPYLHAGAIVPTVALFWGRDEGDYGYFEHYNTVDEVVIIFGADGAVGRARTGLVRLNANTHGVGKFLPEPDNPENFALISITQRQTETDRQEEAVWFKCESCQADLKRLDFAWDPVPAGEVTRRLGETPALETVVKSAEAAERYNASDEDRTCPNCGHVNPPFPLERWGWDRYAAQTEAVRKALASLAGAAAG